MGLYIMEKMVFFLFITVLAPPAPMLVKCICIFLKNHDVIKYNTIWMDKNQLYILKIIHNKVTLSVFLILTVHNVFAVPSHPSQHHQDCQSQGQHDLTQHLN